MNQITCCFSLIMIAQVFSPTLAQENGLGRQAELPDIERMFKELGGRDLEALREKQRRNEQFIRNRRINPLEKQAVSQLALYKPVVAKASESVVAVEVDGKQVALGTIIDALGSVVTKASEIENAQKIFCKFGNGKRLAAVPINVNKEFDLALIYIDGIETKPIQFASKVSDVGSFVATPDEKGDPLNVGVISVGPRSLLGTDTAFLGVQPGPHARGVEVINVEENTAAEVAGMQNGDVIQSVGGVSTKSVTELVNAIRGFRAGDEVEVKVLRGTILETLKAKLDSRDMGGEEAARIKAMNRMGVIPSRRNTEFPTAFQHDSPLYPEQCGGPLVNLKGEVVGINIARGGRVESFAIPGNIMSDLIAKLRDIEQ